MFFQTPKLLLLTYDYLDKRDRAHLSVTNRYNRNLVHLWNGRVIEKLGQLQPSAPLDLKKYDEIAQLMLQIPHPYSLVIPKPLRELKIYSLQLHPEFAKLIEKSIAKNSDPTTYSTDYSTWLLENEGELCDKYRTLSAIPRCSQIVKRLWGPLHSEEDWECCLACITKDGSALKFVPEELRTPALCLAAVTQDKSCIVIVPEALRPEILSRLPNALN